MDYSRWDAVISFLWEGKKQKGNQNYVISTDVDVGQFNSVIIYCKPFPVIFATAPLQ